MNAQRRPRAYYAAGLFNEGERAFNLKVKAVLDELGYDTWFPQEDAGFLEDYIEQGMTLAQARHHIFTQNLEAVENSDLLLFLLDGRVPDEGGCIEAGVAFGRGKRCIGLKTDFRGVEPGGNNLMIDGVLDYQIASNLDELRVLLAGERATIDLRSASGDITIDLRPLEQSYVAISGPLGVGKTSLIERMDSTGMWTVLPEPVQENPYLAAVYSNLSDLGFRMQTFYLGQRARQQHASRGLNGSLVQERCLSEDGEVFAPAYRDHGAYDDNDLETLTTLYQTLSAGIRVPDLIVYLSAPLDVTVDRIRRRDRVEERDLDLELLERIHDRYESWASQQTRAPLLRVDTTELDYVNDPASAAEVMRRIDSALTGAAVLT